MSDGFFAGKVVVVTGGTTGIGRRVAEDFARLGAKVTICAPRDEDVRRAVAEMRSASLLVEGQACDVRHTAQIQALADRVLDREGRVDILINNAGFAVYRAFEESSTEEVVDIVDVNLLGVMRGMKAFLPGMIARRSGHIVNVSSIGGELIITPNASYCGAKHGVVALTRALRYELARFNVLATVVCPDFVPTSFQVHESFRRRDPYRKKTKSEGGLTAADVSAALQSAIRRKKVVAYVPWWAGLIVWVTRVMPGVVEPFWGRIMRKRMEQLYAEIHKERDARSERH